MGGREQGAINSSGPGGDVIIFMTFRFKSNALLNRASLCASSNLQRYFTERPHVCARPPPRARARARARTSARSRDFQQFHDTRANTYVLSFPNPLTPASALLPRIRRRSLGAFYQGSMGKIMALRRDAAQCARGVRRAAAFDSTSRRIPP